MMGIDVGERVGERLPKLSAGAAVTVDEDGTRHVHYRTTVDESLCACCERPHCARVTVDGRAYDLCIVHALRLGRRTAAELIEVDGRSRSWMMGADGVRVQAYEIPNAYRTGGWW